MEGRMYTEEELTQFGDYLFSPEREALVTSHPEFSEETREERLKQVSHADIANFNELLDAQND